MLKLGVCQSLPLFLLTADKGSPQRSLTTYDFGRVELALKELAELLHVHSGLVQSGCGLRCPGHRCILEVVVLQPFEVGCHGNLVRGEPHPKFAVLRCRQRLFYNSGKNVPYTHKHIHTHIHT